MFWFMVMLIVNFAISWFNSYSVGKYWSESKQIGGYFRVSAVIGFALAITGFTLVYGCILLLIFPYVATLIPQLKDVDMTTLMQFTSDLLFLLIGTAIIPIGYFVWFESVVAFWKRKTFANGATAAWNTYANVRNTITYARHAPSAFGRIIDVMFGGKGKKKGNEILIFVAILIIILAILGGYFTASAILKKADREFDGLAIDE